MVADAHELCQTPNVFALMERVRQVREQQPGAAGILIVFGDIPLPFDSVNVLSSLSVGTAEGGERSVSIAVSETHYHGFVFTCD